MAKQSKPAQEMFDDVEEDFMFDAPDEDELLDQVAGMFEGEDESEQEPVPEETEVEGDILEVNGIKCPYSEAELLPIFDSLMFNDTYSERIEVVPGRMWMTFRSRTAEENNKILVMIDKKKFTSIVTLANHQSLLTLAHAITHIAAVDASGKTFNMDLSGHSEKERYEMLSSKPSPVIEAASHALGKFDEKMGWAMRMGLKSF